MIAFQGSECKPSFSLHHLHWPTRSTKTESKHLNQSQLSGTWAQKWHWTVTWRPECSSNTNTQRNQNNTSVETAADQNPCRGSQQGRRAKKGSTGQEAVTGWRGKFQGTEWRCDCTAHTLCCCWGHLGVTPWTLSVKGYKIIFLGSDLCTVKMKSNLEEMMKWFRLHFWAPYD